jgi:hypothetical protein
VSAGSTEDATTALQLLAKVAYLQSAFYGTALGTPVLVVTLTPAELEGIQLIASQENGRVEALKQLLGPGAPAQPPQSAYTFTAGPNAGAFPAVFSAKAEFFKVAQLLEDMGVRAFKGQVAALDANAAWRTTAVQMHQNEARHAAHVRRLRGQNAWITGASPGTGFTGSATASGTQAAVAALVYGVTVADTTVASSSEDNRVQAAQRSLSADAFDEPLDAAGVMAFLTLFGVT